jgi:DNA-binding NtrC family response regulator
MGSRHPPSKVLYGGLEYLTQNLIITNESGRIQVADLPSNMVGHLASTCQDGDGLPQLSTDTSQEGLAGLPVQIHRELDTGDRSLKEIMRDVEREILQQALQMYGSHNKVAERFKVNRSTLFRKLRDTSAR